MDFPSYWQLIRHYNLFLLSGPILLLVSAGFWIRWIRSRRPNPKATTIPRGRLLLFALATLGIGGVHFMGIYTSVVNAARFRFDPRTVTEIRVVRLAEEGSVAEAPVRTISDRALLADGLSRLSAAESRRRNHEHYLDGYRIQIFMPGREDVDIRYLSVYRRSSGAGPVTVVIPHLGPGHAGTVQNAGEYSCPTFLEWVATHIDPTFQDR